MHLRSRLMIAIAAALGILPAARVSAAIDLKAGDWTLNFSGNVNAFYVDTTCDNGANTAVVGGLACTGDRSAAVRNGLLPAALVFGATTHQDDLDIGVTIGFYPGINSNAAAGVNGPGQPSALATPGIDARQAYLTFGNSAWGTVKMGRDIGLFGRDAILDDMTLLGVGSAPNNAAPGNTSLGRIGVGYIYTDWEPQITYTTPTYGGFSASAGVFQPLNAGNYTKHTQPQFQIGGSYAWGDAKSLSGKVWIDLVSQQYQSDLTGGTGSGSTGIASSVTGTGVDGGIKLGYGGFSGVLYGYTGSGLGTTGLFLMATSASGSKRDSDGGYVQAAYQFGKLKVGVSYGMSELKLAGDEVAFDNQLLKRNSSAIGGLYYSLTKSLTLVGEYIDTKAVAWGGDSAHEKDVAIGGIVFF